MHRAALLVLLLAACSSAPTLPDAGSLVCPLAGDAGTFSAKPSSPVPGCSAPPGPTGVMDLAALGWATRGGVLVVPETAPAVPLPVVFGFHGADGEGELIRPRLGLEGPADGGAIFVYPNASRGTWDIGPSSPDAQQVATLLGRLAATYCIDPDRVYIAGFSAGAVFTLSLGCNPKGRYRAMAVIAGTDSRFDNRCCKDALSAIFVHGTQDEAIPLTEGRAAMGRVLGRDRCSTDGAPDGAHCVGYACPAPYAVDFCQWGGDHDVPDWAGEEIARFFSLVP